MVPPGSLWFLHTLPYRTFLHSKHFISQMPLFPSSREPWCVVTILHYLILINSCLSSYSFFSEVFMLFLTWSYLLISKQLPFIALVTVAPLPRLGGLLDIVSVPPWQPRPPWLPCLDGLTLVPSPSDSTRQNSRTSAGKACDPDFVVGVTSYLVISSSYVCSSLDRYFSFNQS